MHAAKTSAIALAMLACGCSQDASKPGQTPEAVAHTKEAQNRANATTKFTQEELKQKFINVTRASAVDQVIVGTLGKPLVLASGPHKNKQIWPNCCYDGFFVRSLTVFPRVKLDEGTDVDPGVAMRWEGFISKNDLANWSKP